VWRCVGFARKAIVDSQDQAILAAIVDCSDDAILSKDLTGTILTWNKAAERLFGYRAAEIVGQPITLLIPPDPIAEENMILGKLRRAKRVEHYETVRLHKDGRPIAVSISVVPLRDASGKVVGAYKTSAVGIRRNGPA
jgi:PAS domain S-box-containing protein